MTVCKYVEICPIHRKVKLPNINRPSPFKINTGINAYGF